MFLINNVVALGNQSLFLEGIEQDPLHISPNVTGLVCVTDDDDGGKCSTFCAVLVYVYFVRLIFVSKVPLVVGLEIVKIVFKIVNIRVHFSK